MPAMVTMMKTTWAAANNGKHKMSVQPLFCAGPFDKSLSPPLVNDLFSSPSPLPLPQHMEPILLTSSQAHTRLGS